MSQEEPVPHHVACIMDGNGRWAIRRVLPVVDGHAAGEEAILAGIRAALKRGVRWLTLFAFSTENWQRSAAEVEFLMGFNMRLIRDHEQFFLREGVRVRYLGEADPRVPADLSAAMAAVQEATQDNRALTLTLAFNHGGLGEIAEMVRRALGDGPSPGRPSAADLRELTQWPDMPDVDLLVRTAGERRLSNFMLVRLAYAELHFTDVLWPDFREHDFDLALQDFRTRKRSFGAR